MHPPAGYPWGLLHQQQERGVDFGLTVDRALLLAAAPSKSHLHGSAVRYGGLISKLLLVFLVQATAKPTAC